MQPVQRLVIASLLKPVDEPRMYAKFAASLRQMPHLEVHIVGYRGQREQAEWPDVHLHPLFSFARLSRSRFLAPFKYFNLLLQLRPQAIIVNSPDLLLVTTLYRIVFGTEMYYDVRENYRLNAEYSGGFSTWGGKLVGTLVRMVEYVCSPWVRHFFLAELVYTSQLGFLGRRYSILPNLAIEGLKQNTQKHVETSESTPPSKMLYSGTISLNYGVVDAVDYALKRNTNAKNTLLTIIGRCHDQQLANKLQALATKHAFIQLEIDSFAKSYDDILKLALSHDAFIAPYHRSPAFLGKIPTKCYEAWAMGKPIYLPVWMLNEVLTAFEGSGIELVYEADLARKNSTKSGQELVSVGISSNNANIGRLFWHDNANANLVVLFAKRFAAR